MLVFICNFSLAQYLNTSLITGLIATLEGGN